MAGPGDQTFEEPIAAEQKGGGNKRKRDDGDDPQARWPSDQMATTTGLTRLYHPSDGALM